jgi:hypothetical protein
VLQNYAIEFSLLLASKRKEIESGCEPTVVELIKVPKSFCRRILVLAVFIAAHSAFAQEEHAATGCAFPAFGWPT